MYSSVQRIRSPLSESKTSELGRFASVNFWPGYKYSDVHNCIFWAVCGLAYVDPGMGNRLFAYLATQANPAKEWHGSGHQPHPTKIFPSHPIPVSYNPIAIGCNPIPMKFIPIPIKSAVVYISADSLIVHRRHKEITALLRVKCTQ